MRGESQTGAWKEAMPEPGQKPQGPHDAGTELAPGVWVAATALRFQFARSGGPGGQNVNKLNTKAELWVPIAALRGLSNDALERLLLLAGKRLTREGEIHIAAETSRSQAANRAAVLERLRQLLLQAQRRPIPRRKTRPTHGSKQRRLEAKKRRANTKTQRKAALDD